MVHSSNAAIDVNECYFHPHLIVKAMRIVVVSILVAIHIDHSCFHKRFKLVCG